MCLFHFDKEKNKLLKKINFEIKYGQSVAFIGSTGVGKSNYSRFTFRII